MIHEKILLNIERNSSLEAFVWDMSDREGSFRERPAVIVCPGGGYHICASREAEPAAAAFYKAGFNAFILWYSVADESIWPAQLEDYEAAAAAIKANAGKWHINPEKIAVCGFSAGGHLASCAAAMAQNRPAAAVLGYPVTGCDERRRADYPANAVAAVSESTCPCFIFATRDDPVVPVFNSLNFMKALEEKAVPFEAHIYSHGQHAYSTAGKEIGELDICPRVPHWVADSIEWLDETLNAL